MTPLPHPRSSQIASVHRLLREIGSCIVKARAHDYSPRETLDDIAEIIFEALGPEPEVDPTNPYPYDGSVEL